MKILITGGAGFIGSNVVDYFIEKGLEVVIVDNLSTGKTDFINDKAIFYNFDIKDERLLDVFEKEKPDVVIHFAAQIDVQTSLKKPHFDGSTNIVGSINVLECCRKTNVKKIIYASSAAVYGNPEYLPVDEKHRLCPLSFYGISKHTPEHYLKVYNELYDLKYTVLRYSNAYGIRQDPKGEGGVISIFIDKIKKNEELIIFGDGEQTRDFIFIKDIVQANYLALSKGDNEIINISTNTPVTINEVVNYMEKIVDKKLKKQYMDSRNGDILYSYLNNNKAKSILGFNPNYNLESGLKQTLEYYLR